MNADTEFGSDGDIVRGTFASYAAKIRLNPLCYFRHVDGARILASVWAVLVLLPVLVALPGWWIAAAVLAVPALLLTALLVWIHCRAAEIFYSAALTPGLVVKLAPTELISLADMDTGFGEEALAVKRVALPYWAPRDLRVGDTLPCVSGFQDGPDRRRWGDFDPMPLAFGTTDRRTIEARRKKLGEAGFDRLKRLYEQRTFPDRSGALLWLNLAHQPPPPLPQG